MQVAASRTAALLFVLGLVGIAVATAEDKKRREPKPVSPIEVGGLRYEAVLTGAPYGYRQDGGIVAARNVATGRLEWTQKIYDIEYDDSIEDDKQDVFIAAMTLTADRRHLLITNERGARFELDLTGRVTHK